MIGGGTNNIIQQRVIKQRLIFCFVLIDKVKVAMCINPHNQSRK